jgi:F-type H+-transporting ATPase subunit delta
MEEIAQVYARALFDAAKEREELDEVREELATFADAVDGSRDLQVFLFSPYLSTDEKKEGLRRAIEGASETFLNFLDVLVENHRMPAIFRIRRRFDELWQEEKRLLPVEITSAVDLDEATVRQVGDTIGEQTGRSVELSSRVDPDILGGIVVRVGNVILDASIRNRLEQLRKQVAKAA